MSAGVDVQAVLRRLSANVEFASLKREASEALDALAELQAEYAALRSAWEKLHAACEVVPEGTLSSRYVAGVLNEAIAAAVDGGAS
jgi:predicted nuclease with TOPRIM domain